MIRFAKYYGVVEDTEIEYPDDVDEIQAWLLAREIVVSKPDIQAAYREYSERFWAAGWISIGNIEFPGLLESGILVYIEKPNF